MTFCQIISEREDVTNIIKIAISSEIKRLEIGLNRTNKEIKKLEAKYKTSSEIIVKEFTSEDLTGGDDEYIMWSGELKLRDSILEEIEK